MAEKDEKCREVYEKLKGDKTVMEYERPETEKQEIAPGLPKEAGDENKLE